MDDLELWVKTRQSATPMYYRPG